MQKSPKVAEYTGQITPGQQKLVTKCGKTIAEYQTKLAEMGCELPPLQTSENQYPELYAPPPEGSNVFVPEWRGGATRRRSKSRQSLKRRRRSS